MLKPEKACNGIFNSHYYQFHHTLILFEVFMIISAPHLLERRIKRNTLVDRGNLSFGNKSGCGFQLVFKDYKMLKRKARSGSI